MKMGTWEDSGSPWSLYGDVKSWDLKTESYSFQYQVSLLLTGWFTGAFSEAQIIWILCWSAIVYELQYFYWGKLPFEIKPIKTRFSILTPEQDPREQVKVIMQFLKNRYGGPIALNGYWQGCQLCSLCIWTGHPMPPLGALAVLVHIYSYSHSCSQTRGHRDMK